ncbi:MAG: ABC-2 transporter permease [Eubacteriaceae bacterium]|nr:ABC-2 transporter permease [Eubacteriaceae bacterium]
MKRIAGLMRNDFYEIMGAGRTLIIVILMYLVLGQIFYPNIADVGMLICLMLPVNTIGYDERSGWNRYVLSFPVTKKEIVLSKYLLGYLFMAAGFAIRLTAGVLSGHSEGILLACAASAMLGLMYMAIQMPVMLRFGIEQGRMWTMLFTVVFAFGAVYASQISLSAIDAMRYAALALPVLVILLQPVSIRISTALYGKR